MIIPCPKSLRNGTNKKCFQRFFHVFHKAMIDNHFHFRFSEVVPSANWFLLQNYQNKPNCHAVRQLADGMAAFLGADFWNKSSLMHERKPHNFTSPLTLSWQEREKARSPSSFRRRG